MSTGMTIEIEDRHSPPFFKKIPVSIERGEGVCVWDEEGNRFLDLRDWGRAKLTTQNN
jgi:acetylornithine/N-succinyldiaminopimelate aminotransferase